MPSMDITHRGKASCLELLVTGQAELLNISYACEGIPLLVFIAKVDRPRFIQEFFRLRRDDSYMSDLHIRLQPIGHPPIQASLMGQAIHDSYNKRLSVVWALHN